VSKDKIIKFGSESQDIKPFPGIHVVVPDGRTGTLDKWPEITANGLVKVNLDGGGCYVCRLSDLHVDQRYLCAADNQSTTSYAGGMPLQAFSNLAELNPE
jgi:hypothetical protein